ncbi:hypothetical protein QMK19_37845 [Streptomyces sp. H10-C2]|uniref:hypothetical protein n=1 Tax=unclassified Streptomyces TaxID=2593676 RepID=UPI0024BA8702|nr:MULTISPECIES: hypothetical protein [unclassified Streptomyces]MDJ0340452.1 hypothetical protein [Streptomyces sp. PH10-H1]MDJ0375214.1 hypothetical protein [Streptomyces sp. H10-C2]
MTSPLASPRPFVAAAAASVLAALYFVPSATASPSPAPASQVKPPATGSGATTSTRGTLHLAATGTVDTTPYLIGGAAFLVGGAGLVLNAGRRARQEAP